MKSDLDLTRGEIQFRSAGFGVRLVALIVDSFIVLSASVLFALLLKQVWPFETALEFTVGLVVIFGKVIYSIVPIFVWGQTPGKRLVKIRVINVNGSSKISLLDVIYRETLAKFLSGIIFYVGYLMAAFTDDKRALHDRLAGTRVVFVSN
jgi:uncharacterized RDD family membrane protein YckC